MFPISIKIVVEEDAVDFGLHLTVPDKLPPTHPLPISPHFINDQSPPPQCPNGKEKEREREKERKRGAMGVEKRRGGRLSESARQSYKRPFMYSYP